MSSKLKWVLLTLGCVIIFLFVPVRLFHFAETLVIIVAGISTAACVYKMCSHYVAKVTQVMYGVIMATVFLISMLYIKSYHYRLDRLFEREGDTTEGEIVDRSLSRRGKLSAYEYSYYLIYKYRAGGGFYIDQCAVPYEVVINFRLGPKITIDFIKGSENISRINERSLVIDTSAVNEYRRWEEEHNRIRRAQ